MGGSAPSHRGGRFWKTGVDRSRIPELQGIAAMWTCKHLSKHSPRRLATWETKLSSRSSIREIPVDLKEYILDKEAGNFLFWSGGPWQGSLHVGSCFSVSSTSSGLYASGQGSPPRLRSLPSSSHSPIPAGSLGRGRTLFLSNSIVLQS